MNFLANGGSLAKSCKAVFKTTATITEMNIKPLAYPNPPTKILKFPQVTLKDELYRRLPTGNVTVHSGYSKAIESMNTAGVVLTSSPSRK
ncbi:unnamed protein product [Pieris macdunnoughi]|uniref:Uncharacterized protein n=1 Tax=Pieris macdunnoughi TaxID=345717 RepID=A0A821XXT2_9NEOP|nr:unnamed protein product [Pieris macdunnoughi]